MEVRLEPAEGKAVPPMPQETFVSLRIGDVQKQSRLGAPRTYKFPDPGEGRRNFARIEVFKRVGHATVSFTGDGDFQNLEVPCQLDGFNAIPMRLMVTGTNEQKLLDAAEKKGRAKVRVDAAARYLAQHHLEELLADCMREVIFNKPDDPHAFLSQMILSNKGMFPPKPDLVDTLPMAQLPSVATWFSPGMKRRRQQAAPPQPTVREPVVEIPFVWRPSVGTWLAPPPKILPGSKVEALEVPGAALSNILNLVLANSKFSDLPHEELLSIQEQLEAELRRRSAKR